MNTVDCYVTEVLSDPHPAWGKWWVAVAYNCWGDLAEHKLMFDTKEAAEAVRVGYHFLA